MFVTSYASVFILKDSLWVAAKEGLSWAYIRLKTEISSEGSPCLKLSVSAHRDFDSHMIIFETKVISSSKWILVADDFAEFEVDKQRYGAYFENDKTASAFTAAIAEGIQEIRTGHISPLSYESTIDRHTGALKQRHARTNSHAAGAAASAALGEGSGPGESKKPIRRRSLAQFADVKEAIDSCSVTVTETLDLGAAEGGRVSDVSREHDARSAASRTVQSDDLDFDWAVEKQITTVYHRGTDSEDSRRKELEDHDRSSPLNSSRSEEDSSSSAAPTGSGLSVTPASGIEARTDSAAAPKKNNLSLSSLASIFRKPQRSATPDKESEYRRGQKSCPPPPSPEKERSSFSGCLPHLRSGDCDDIADIDSALISAPASVLHMTSVHFNEELGRYEGLPSEWKGQNRVFGSPLHTLPKRADPSGDYSEPIPTALLLMKEHLLRLEARQVVGIFRLAPDKDACSEVKDLINLGDYDYSLCQDPNILANLLKVFFRELPQNLFNAIPEREILKIASLATIDEIVTEMETNIIHNPSYSLILWLLDVMAVVVMNEGVNKMSAKNMAIVVSPNLYAVNSENPMVALTMAQKVAEFTTKLLAGRLKVKHGYDAGIK